MAENQQDKYPERPLECSDCKKSISIVYTEVIGDQIVRTSMCADCPEYQKRLHGGSHMMPILMGEGANLACGNCGTTLESLKMGHPIGCPTCYEIFEDVIFQELLLQNRLPSRITSFKKTIPIHIGRKPGEAKELNLSAKLLALNEALTETLKAENYEEAALLRDQIRQLTEKNPELKERP